MEIKYDHLLVRFGELALKGRNRNEFEKKLKENVRHALKEHPSVKIKRTYGRIMVELHGEQESPIIEKLKNVFGISSFSLAMKAENNEESIKETALQAFLQHEGKKSTFKIESRRAYKDFPISTRDLNPLIGTHILKNTENVTVDVHQPDVEVSVEVREQGTYISCGRVEGAGGLPVGTSAKVMLMLSGGIDSPVAGYLTMKRGATVEAVHFHSPPYTNERARKKVEDLANLLTAFGGPVRLHIVPFTNLQKAIHENIHSNYTMTIMRRMMLRITDRLTAERRAKAIVNGESLGQVASQTLESMHAINEVTTCPILRPLVTMDKLEVIDIAEKIGTYPISILPYDDCCTVFLPPESVTKPTREKASRFEKAFDFEPFIEEALQNIEMVTLDGSNKNEKEMDDLL
ncbi:tRNA uracil 4-sulfurtransferase ThiI [Alteribacillus sp. HJP-4]|uniref:tRNA uracil 4-sulfurtransferase ThiI n=1 Tax=Alteribacillus sp. HJP-4 TaxID=2775394 RepID=UPI0035CCF277